MRRIIVVFLLCSSLGALSQEPISSKKDASLSTANVVNLSMLGLLYDMDTVTTHKILSQGGKELILPESLAKRPVAMTLLGAGKMYGHFKLDQKLNRSGHHKWALVADYADMIVTGIVVGHNIAEIQGQRQAPNNVRAFKQSR